VVHSSPDESALELPPEWIGESFRTNSRLTGLLWLLKEEDLKATANTMTPKDVEQGEEVITEGSVGTRFYIIEYGSFEVYVSSPEAPFPGIKVGELGPGGSFGELALLYSQARSATVVATSRARLWVMERAAFQNAVSQGWNQNLPANFITFLESVPLFRGIERSKLKQLGRAMLPKWFGKGESLIQKGDWDERFFVLRTGAAAAVEQLPEGEREVELYTEPGSVIGGDVLLQEYRQPAERTVKSQSDVTVAFWMSKLTFDNVMGHYKEDALRNLKHADEQDQCVCM